MNWVDKLKIYLVVGSRDCKWLPPLEVIEKALLAGVRTVQLREKDGDLKEIIDLGKQIRVLTKKYNSLFFVNDRLDLAQILEADGIHLGQDDLPINEVKRRVPSSFKIGISARTVDEARLAEQEGADYLGVGSVFQSTTKNDAKWIGVEGLKEIKKLTALPIVAIGGIGKDHINELYRNGANGIAVVSAITQTRNPYEGASQLLKEWERFE